MVNYIVYNGVSTLELGFYLGGVGDDKSAERDITTQSIDGRNGDLVFDNGRYKNVSVKYGKSVIYENMEENLFKLKEALQPGYHRLEDSFHPDEFYLAYFDGEIEPSVSNDRSIATVSLTFNRKPQRFLKSGETLTQVTSGTVLTNPTNQTALPLINCYGSGTLTLGSQTLKITGNPYEYITVDSDIKDCYFGDKNCNGYVTADGFPELGAGDTTVTFTGFTKIEIAPRWWRL